MTNYFDLIDTEIAKLGRKLTEEEVLSLYNEYTKLNDPNMNKDGIAWYDAPIPSVEHACWVQTSGIVGSFIVDRCACGAIRHNHNEWENRNSREDNK